jgi:DNA-binding IclR family transcriptional regulator
MVKKHNLTGRSKRELSPFIALERYIKASAAWQSLSIPARCAYLEFLDIYDGNNNGRIAMSASSLAAKLPIGRATASRAISELEDRGFIEAVRRGGFNVKHGLRRATEWRLTRFHCQATGTPASRNFMRWHQDKIHLAVSSQSTNGLILEQLQ